LFFSSWPLAKTFFFANSLTRLLPTCLLVNEELFFGSDSFPSGKPVFHRPLTELSTVPLRGVHAYLPNHLLCQRTASLFLPHLRTLSQAPLSPPLAQIYGICASLFFFVQTQKRASLLFPSFSGTFGTLSLFRERDYRTTRPPSMSPPFCTEVVLSSTYSRQSTTALPSARSWVRLLLTRYWLRPEIALTRSNFIRASGALVPSSFPPRGKCRSYVQVYVRSVLFLQCQEDLQSTEFLRPRA